MNRGQRMKRECDEKLRGLVGAGERVLAGGTASLLRGSDDEGSGEWRFLVVTGQRLLSAHWGHPDRLHEDLSFDAVTAWADGTQYHRYVVLLRHAPVTRSQAGPWWHRLPFLGRSVRKVTRTSTVLRFSRRDTAAASALRASLSDRGARHADLALQELTRAERTRGSRVALRIVGPAANESGRGRSP